MLFELRIVTDSPRPPFVVQHLLMIGKHWYVIRCHATETRHQFTVAEAVCVEVEQKRWLDLLQFTPSRGRLIHSAILLRTRTAPLDAKTHPIIAQRHPVLPMLSTPR